jgi:PhnB protein
MVATSPGRSYEHCDGPCGQRDLYFLYAGVKKIRWDVPVARAALLRPGRPARPWISFRIKMANQIKTIPDGYHSITPYLSIKGAAEALAFYKRAFGAAEIYRLGMPGGKIGHAEIQIGNSRIMLADEMPEMPDAIAKSPRSLQGTTFGLHIYVDDVDAQFQRAIDAGATVKRPVKDQFYGDRSGTLEDPFGHIWTIATHIEDVSIEEIGRRVAAMPTE